MDDDMLKEGAVDLDLLDDAAEGEIGEDTDEEEETEDDEESLDFE